MPTGCRGVLRAARGTRHDELTLTLAGGLQLVGFAAHPNRLRAGSRAQAQVEPSAVVLALRWRACAAGPGPERH
ncbi:MAG: hypothetical protein U1E79_14405 [Ottowia sp.]